jgi:hypothetical protein
MWILNGNQTYKIFVLFIYFLFHCQDLASIRNKDSQEGAKRFNVEFITLVLYSRYHGFESHPRTVSFQQLFCNIPQPVQESNVF